MIQAAVAPSGPADVWFTNPLLSVLPRLFIGPLSWLVWRALQKKPALGLIAAGVTGSVVNTVLVLTMVGILGFVPWAALPAIALANGVPEAMASAILVLLVVAAVRQIQIGRGKSRL